MRPDGWIFLTVSWGLIVGLCAFCLRRILRRGRR